MGVLNVDGGLLLAGVARGVGGIELAPVGGLLVGPGSFPGGDVAVLFGVLGGSEGGEQNGGEEKRRRC